VLHAGYALDLDAAIPFEFALQRRGQIGKFHSSRVRGVSHSWLLPLFKRRF
jgi:hypothetical protein